MQHVQTQGFVEIVKRHAGKHRKPLEEIEMRQMEVKQIQQKSRLQHQNTIILHCDLTLNLQDELTLNAPKHVRLC